MDDVPAPSELDWHPAGISLRAGRYYVVMTVPKPARPALSGQTQVRQSAKTTDRKIAEQKRYEIETKLREQVVDKVRAYRLKQRDSRYSEAVHELGLQDIPYDHWYAGESADVLLRELDEPPETPQQAVQAKQALAELLHEIRGLDLFDDPQQLRDLDNRLRDGLPDTSHAERLIKSASQELDDTFQLPDASPTVTTYLETYEAWLERQVDQGHLKSKTVKARGRDIRQFCDLIGDLRLIDLRAAHAYDFANQLAESHGNSTIKTRVSNVSLLLEHAVHAGKLEHNPFTSLKLSGYGTPGRHYTPLTDELLHSLFGIPNLPRDVRDMWAVLISTGMRLDEAALCKAHQVKSQDGIRYIDLQNAEVKTRQSQRRVPICATLEPLIEELIASKAPEDRLFGFAEKRGGKSRASEVCGYWLKKVDLKKISGDKNARYTNHSLRGSFKDKMRDADVSAEVHNAIMGHEQDKVAAAYGRGPSLRSMKEAVDRADHPYLSWIS